MKKLVRALSWRRIYFKVVSQEGTPESVARGVGLGVFVGFAFPLGTHLLLGLPLAFLLRANKFLMVLFTMPVNPYTLPFIYPLQCWLGARLMGRRLTLHEMEDDFAHVFADPSWSSFKTLGAEVMWPLLIGGALIGLLGALLGYFAALGLVQSYRKKRERALRRRLSLSSKREKTVSIRIE